MIFMAFSWCLSIFWEIEAWNDFKSRILDGILSSKWVKWQEVDDWKQIIIERDCGVVWWYFKILHEFKDLITELYLYNYIIASKWKKQWRSWNDVGLAEDKLWNQLKFWFRENSGQVPQFRTGPLKQFDHWIVYLMTHDPRKVILYHSQTWSSSASDAGVCLGELYRIIPQMVPLYMFPVQEWLWPVQRLSRSPGGLRIRRLTDCRCYKVRLLNFAWLLCVVALAYITLLKLEEPHNASQPTSAAPAGGWGTMK